MTAWIVFSVFITNLVDRASPVGEGEWRQTYSNVRDIRPLPYNTTQRQTSAASEIDKSLAATATRLGET